ADREGAGRPRVRDAVPCPLRRGATDDPARGGRHVRRACRSRRCAEGSSRCRQLLRPESPLHLRPLPPRGRRRRPRLLRLLRPRQRPAQAPAAPTPTRSRRGVASLAARPPGRPPRRVVARRCCAAACLRGALLGSGTLSGPRGPHLAIRTAEAEGAEFLAGLAARLGAELHVQGRVSHATAYAKGTEAIADVLVAAGAGAPVL